MRCNKVDASRSGLPQHSSLHSIRTNNSGLMGSGLWALGSGLESFFRPGTFLKKRSMEPHHTVSQPISAHFSVSRPTAGYDTEHPISMSGANHSSSASASPEHARPVHDIAVNSEVIRHHFKRPALAFGGFRTSTAMCPPSDSRLTGVKPLGLQSIASVTGMV